MSDRVRGLRLKFKTGKGFGDSHRRMKVSGRKELLNSTENATGGGRSFFTDGLK